MSRRGMFVIAFISGVVVAPVLYSLTSIIVKPAMAQEEDLIVIEPTTQDLPTSQDLIVVQPIADNSNPRDVYLELVKQKLQFLSLDQLARETEFLRRELVELDANRKLHEAEKQLRQLIEDHPGSSASDKAKFMLDAGLRPIPQRDEGYSAPLFDRDSGRPTGRRLPADNLIRPTNNTIEYEETVRPRNRPHPVPEPRAKKSS